MSVFTLKVLAMCGLALLWLAGGLTMLIPLTSLNGLDPMDVLRVYIAYIGIFIISAYWLSRSIGWLCAQLDKSFY